MYLGIDLHRKQMTVSLRNQDGDVLLRRQVSTRWPKLEEFREQLRQVAAVEVCGFQDWLVKWLQQDQRCHKVLVVQPLGRSANKTDRRDAHALSELLWINRERLLRGDRVQGVRTVHLPGVEEQADRRLTQVRERLVWRRTQTLNQIHKILRRHNLEWERPTKTFQTRKVVQWLKTLQLKSMDRLTMNQLLVQWKLWEEQLLAVNHRIAERFRANRDAQLLATMPGVSMFIAVAIASRIVPIGRFPRGRSLANLLGLTPGCRSSGDSECLGAITKVGRRMVRFLLAQVILHLLRRDHTVQRGDQWRGPCPVHGSRNPRSRSFSVNVRLGRYQCFGCGSRGHALELWSAVHGSSVYAATVELCQLLGVEIPWVTRW